MNTRAWLDGEERYELLGELASGGMATVYLARLRRPMGFSRLVAIKCMHPQFAKDPSFATMFLDEARLTARLRHPNVVPTLDIVHEDGHLLLVMEYVEGGSLSQLLRSASSTGGRVPVSIACAIVHDVLLGLHEAHQAKDDENVPLAIIHRDVSPQNVLVGLDGLSRVLDFGVAKAKQNIHQSNDNEIKGKIPYMPPEQLFGEAIDHRVDVYAAGVTLWEALVCRRLFDGPSETVLVRQISEDPIAPPSSCIDELPKELDAIVMKALARDPSERFESALAMAEALSSAVTLATRTEVSTWVRQYLEPRSIPSTTGFPYDDSSSASRMLAALTRAQHSSSHVVNTITETLSSVEDVARSKWVARLAAGVAIAAASVAIWASTTQMTERDKEATVAVSPRDGEPIGARAEIESNIAQVAPVITTPLVEVEEAVPPPSTRVVSRASRATTLRPKASQGTSLKEQASVGPAQVAPKVNCAIPFTIDDKGLKHFKVECLH